MRSGDRPGLQNRRVASSGVTGGFDSHSLPPVVCSRENSKATMFSIPGKLICTPFGFPITAGLPIMRVDQFGQR
jgi:hypothetical protein